MRLISLLLVAFVTLTLASQSCCPPQTLVTIPKYHTVHIPEYVETLNFKPIPVVTECPKDYSQQKKLCIKIVKSDTICPTGSFRMNDDECHFVKVVAKRQATLKPIVCPRGFVQKGKYRCVKVTKCPKGFRKVRGDCIPRDIACPVGSIRFGRSCIYHVHKCPTGFIMKDRKCHKELSYCPEGYTLVGGECKSNTACPKGYRMRRGLCLKTITKCPEGTTKKGTRCIETLNTTDKCPSGYILFNGACKKVQITCPHGFIFNGKCENQTCSCGKDFDPVCGFDGITYKNACEAMCLKTTIRYAGACSCTRKCPTYLQPVCGSDGVTYQNSCMARISGVTMIKGAC